MMRGEGTMLKRGILTHVGIFTSGTCPLIIYTTNSVHEDNPGLLPNFIRQHDTMFRRRGVNRAKNQIRTHEGWYKV
jgi:hypothetical protein